MSRAHGIARVSVDVRRELTFEVEDEIADGALVSNAQQARDEREASWRVYSCGETSVSLIAGMYPVVSSTA
jgi:hypothetical protein